MLDLNNLIVSQNILEKIEEKRLKPMLASFPQKNEFN